MVSFRTFTLLESDDKFVYLKVLKPILLSADRHKKCKGIKNETKHHKLKLTCFKLDV